MVDRGVGIDRSMRADDRSVRVDAIRLGLLHRIGDGPTKHLMMFMKPLLLTITDSSLPALRHERNLKET